MPKRKAYSVKEKLVLIDRIKAGESQAKVCRETGVHEATLRGWIRDESKLRNFVHNVEESEWLSRKRARKAHDSALDSAVYNWFVQERVDGTPISGEVVRVQAEKLHKAIHGSHKETAVSRGWLQRWQKRHGVTQVKICGEVKSADLEAAASFPPSWKPTWMRINWPQSKSTIVMKRPCSGVCYPAGLLRCKMTLRKHKATRSSKTASLFYCAAIQLGHTSCGL